MRYTFKAYERLKREQHIDTLFRTGKAFSVFPVKILYLLVPRLEGELSPVRIGFSVPKKKFRKSTERNRLKRLCREAWRLQKQELYHHIPPGRQLHLFMIYTAGEETKTDVLKDCVTRSMERLTTIIKAHA